MHLGGSGIGLNLCRSIVRLHGGDVYAHNREDGKSGACFIIELPLGKEHLKNNQIYSDNRDTKRNSSEVRLAETVNPASG